MSRRDHGSYRPGYAIAAERILAYIADNGLRAGDRLPTEQQFCEILEVSRSVCREAVKVLSALERVTVRKGAGLFVAEGPGLSIGAETAWFQPADLDQVRMLFEFRTTVESETARMAAERAAPGEVNAINEAAERSVSAAQKDDFDAFRRADEEFHNAVARGGHNDLLAASVGQITQLKRQVLTIGLRGSASGSLVSAAAQHLDIARAISSGDALAAGSAMARHIEIARDQFQDRIKNRLLDLVEPDSDGR